MVGTTYTGTIDSSGTYMEGTMLSYSGTTGCWSATKAMAQTTTKDNFSDWGNEPLNSAGE